MVVPLVFLTEAQGPPDPHRPSDPLGGGPSCSEPLELSMVVLWDLLVVLAHLDPKTSSLCGIIFMQPDGTTLDPSIAGMNRYDIQLLTAQMVANAQLQLKAQHHQVVQMVHTDAIRT